MTHAVTAQSRVMRSALMLTLMVRPSFGPSEQVRAGDKHQFSTWEKSVDPAQASCSIVCFFAVTITQSLLISLSVVV